MNDFENVNSLLKNFLDHWPESYNDYDQKRFAKYAIEARKENLPFPLQAFQDKGISEKAIDYYQVFYKAVGLTLDVLHEDYEVF